jgi:hypothetical protein
MSKTFTELSRARIKESRQLVISKLNDSESFTIAQQVLINEDQRQMTMYLKGAIHIENIDGLYNLRDAVNEAIAKTEK